MKSTTRSLVGFFCAGFIMAASLPTQAAFLTQYGAFKIRDHQQTGPLPANPPTISDYGVFGFALQTEVDALLFGTVSAGGPAPLFLAPDSEDPIVLSGDAQFGSLAGLNAAAPSDTFSFQFLSGEGDQLNASIAAGTMAFPDAPALKNFAAAQDIDGSQAFTLQWDKAPQLGAADYVIVEIDVDGDTALHSPFPWEAGALTGTATSFTIPAGTLPAEAELGGRINFIKITGNNASAIPGATGLVGYISGTDFPLTLHGGGGGGDTTPPVMFMAQPINGATGVNANAVVSFTFSEAMQAQQSIQWNGVPNPASFTYVWSGNGTTLNCTYPGGFPANTTISWQLAPANFRDLAGNELVPFQLSGQFTTGSGGSGGCENGIENQSDTFVVARLASFEQTSAGAPVPKASGGGSPAAGFFANFRPVTFAATGASVQIPGGQTKTLNALLGFFLFQEGFADEAALNTAYPTGNYTANVQHAGGTASQTIALGAAPTTPHCANFTAAQAINPAADFILTWDAFAGATANDVIDLSIHSEGTEIFRLPDNCATPPKRGIL